MIAFILFPNMFIDSISDTHNVVGYEPFLSVVKWWRIFETGLFSGLQGILTQVKTDMPE